MKAALFALMLTLGAAPAWAQDGEPVLVEALVVNAPTPGPAWWSVGNGNVKVWVLGVGVAVPASATWNDKVFKRRVKATGRVIAVRSSWTNFTRESVRTDRDWLAELSEPERVRLAEIAAASEHKVEFYRGYRPNFAGILIKTDLEKRAKPAGPLLDLQSKARRLGAKLVLVSGDEAQAFKIGFAAGGSDKLDCVRWAIRPRDAATQREQWARAWMNGDVRALMIGPAAYDPCLLATKTLQDTLESGETAVADAIAESLDRNERAVALVGLTPLLRQGGVLDQLRRRGYVVETPAQLDD